MPVQLEDGTIAETGWTCPICQRTWSESTTGLPVPRGLYVNNQWVCAACAANRDRPWMTALEMQFAAMRFVEHAAEMKFTPQTRKLAGLCSMARAPLKHALAYSWSHETYSAVEMASKTIPLETTMSRDLLPEHACWWWFGETPYLFGTESDVFTVVALLIFCDKQDRVSFLTFSKPQDEAVPSIPSTWWTWGRGESYGDIIRRLEPLRDGNDQTSVHARHLARFTVAALGWLQQRILSASVGHVERHRRKQLAREHGAVISDVKVIQLRRTEPRQNSDSQHGEFVEWSCRWIVNGHWRNQPYANGERKLIYILPYVKGPDDKPLKVPTHTVYSVSR